MPSDRSRALFDRALAVMPGGVNSPVRAFGAVGGTPLFISKAAGARVYDADGREYIDWVGSWGPMILGHAHPRVVATVKEASERGMSYGAPTEREVELAELIREAHPAMERLRLVNSGTEATMSAIRLARGFTGRSRILKFDGCYHGHADSLLARAGSGLATFGIPASPGVPDDLARLTLTAPYNDLGEVERLAEACGNDLAAVIVEPIAANMGLVLPDRAFLKGLRDLTKTSGSLLIFDEVISGFRAAWGGATKLYDIRPDLTCLGKVIGGGMPIGAYGGRADVMAKLAPDGPVYQAGTLSGNPVAVAAGLETLRVLKEENPYARLREGSERLAEGLAEAARRAAVEASVVSAPGLVCLFFSREAPRNFEEVSGTATDRYPPYFHAMLAESIYLPPSAFEVIFLSTAHRESDIDRTVKAAETALASAHS